LERMDDCVEESGAIRSFHGCCMTERPDFSTVMGNN